MLSESYASFIFMVCWNRSPVKRAKICMYNRLEDGPGQARAGINAPSPFSSLLLCSISDILLPCCFRFFTIRPSSSLVFSSVPGRSKLIARQSRSRAYSAGTALAEKPRKAAHWQGSPLSARSVTRRLPRRKRAAACLSCISCTRS